MSLVDFVMGAFVTGDFVVGDFVMGDFVVDSYHLTQNTKFMWFKALLKKLVMFSFSIRHVT